MDWQRLPDRILAHISRAWNRGPRRVSSAAGARLFRAARQGEVLHCASGLWIHLHGFFHRFLRGRAGQQPRLGHHAPGTDADEISAADFVTGEELVEVVQAVTIDDHALKTFFFARVRNLRAQTRPNGALEQLGEPRIAGGAEDAAAGQGKQFHHRDGEVAKIQLAVGKRMWTFLLDTWRRRYFFSLPGASGGYFFIVIR